MASSLDEASEATGPRQPRVVILTGLSGSGKTTAIRALEDIGYFCIDNLPVPLLPKVLELAETGPSRQDWRRMAFVVDTRAHHHLDDAEAIIAELRDEGISVQIVFLEATDDCLVRRFSETRRRHPMSEGDTVREAIRRERNQLADLRAWADIVVDTTNHTPHTLKDLLKEHFSSEEAPGLSITVLSFGFKHGLPVECDLVFDVRFLANPHFVEDLRPKTGLEQPVQHFVLSLPEAARFLALFQQLAEFILPMYDREGKSYLTIGIGCTGGKHRSVAISETIGDRLRARGWQTNVRHRDVPRYSNDDS